MSAAAQTKIFGIKVGLDPKILVGALIAVAAFLFWYNSRGDEETHAPAAVARQEATATPAVAVPRHSSATRRRAAVDERGTLRFRQVSGARGDVDPVLRLDLLERLRKVAPAEKSHNVFEIGAVAQGAAAEGVPVRRIHPTPLPQAPDVYAAANQAPAMDIPLKYYGFAKPVSAGEKNSGFFLSGDDVLVGSEGELLQSRYLVVQLTATSAKLEDTQLKQGQTLPVVPEAQEQQGGG